MEWFLKEVVEWSKFELLIDSNIFWVDIVMKAAYNFLDKGYFFFKLDDTKNIILQYTTKEEVKDSPMEVIWNFSDSLLEVYLRNKLEIDNKVIREAIVTKAINGPIDTANFISLDTNTAPSADATEFDKSIDDILKEIENDPELKIDEAEIEKILKEIEEEGKNDVKKPTITIDPNAIQDAKKKFQN